MRIVQYNSETTVEPIHFFPWWMELILGILIIIVLILFFRSLFKDLFISLFSKKQSVKAVLVSKIAEPYVTKKAFISNNGYNSGVGTGVAEKGLDYFFTFQLENNKMITLNGTKSLYDVALEGSSGILTYRGKLLISYDGPTEGTRTSQDSNNYNFVGINHKL